jgi:glycine cleavage system aminomethyltransferase T
MSQRETYEALLRAPDAPFVVERPALFSPAAAVQDEVSQKGAYARFGPLLLPTEYTEWVDECRSWVASCYLGDWSSLGKVEVRGPQALAFLSWLGLRDLSQFAIGQIKHHVQLDEHGWVASEGILCRLGEDAFLYTAGSIEWLQWQFGQGDWDAELTDVTPDRFIFGVQGPRSRACVERVLATDLGDLAFNHSRDARAGSVPLRVLRTGISGELGYELHGPAEAAAEVWSAVTAAGEDLDLRLLGLRSQAVQHIEAGIATNGLDYFPASALTPGAPKLFRRTNMGGSFVPQAFTDYFRRPDELNWMPRGGVPAHDFLGRDALLAEGESARTLVGLHWNAEDVLATFAALFGGDPVDPMELPRRQGPAFDQVLVAGAPVGVSSGRTLSVNLRAMISLCVIDRAHAAPGTPVTVLWGRPGTNQREIRATVSAVPMKPDRRRG